MYDGLPKFCYHTHPTTGKTVILQRGVVGYYDTGLDTPATVLNRHLGVTPAQAEAMFVGSMFGWEVPGANPEMYDENGKLKAEQRMEGIK
jgi:hypothetical protein